MAVMVNLGGVYIWGGGRKKRETDSTELLVMEVARRHVGIRDLWRLFANTRPRKMLNSPEKFFFSQFAHWASEASLTRCDSNLTGEEEQSVMNNCLCLSEDDDWCSSNCSVLVTFLRGSCQWGHVSSFQWWFLHVRCVLQTQPTQNN